MFMCWGERVTEEGKDENKGKRRNIDLGRTIKMERRMGPSEHVNGCTEDEVIALVSVSFFPNFSTVVKYTYCKMYHHNDFQVCSGIIYTHNVVQRDHCPSP